MITSHTNTFIAHHISPEQRLYKSILATAVLDASGRATGANTPQDAAQAKKEAVQWFETAGPDFVEVCDLAGFEPDVVRSKVQAYLATFQDMKSKPNADRAASIRDVAAHANVSGGTAHRVLTNSPSVSQSTRQRVKDAIAALQYQTSRPHIYA